MADLLTVVPGSRRPIRVDSTGVVVNIAIQGPDYSSVSSKIGTNSSASRRKPQTTYRSPSLQFSNDLCIERSGQYVRHSPSGHGPPVPTTRTSNASPAHGGATGAPANSATLKPKYPMKPPLPIYHPLGRLALSLPQLDLSAHPQGLLNQTDDASRGAAPRSRRPAARVRDAAETDSVDASTPLAVPADAQIPPEKPSPRKRRAGGQSSSRRRRRDADDGDATYPAKRTRANRAPPEGMKAPERRSTRSRAAAQVKPPPVRRNSSASDRTQTSVSVSIAGSQPVDFAAPNATVRSSVTSPGQAEAVPVAKVTLEEPPTQTAQTWVTGQAKVPETQPVTKMDVDEAPRGTEDAGLGASAAVGTPLKPEEDERSDEAGPRLPSS
ncbi:hypothetical protein BGY98DRAFT_1004167 [Russula aff. rugulosa BPL654]|nr:hypothetical protein BGY98DRAFT_1004167 [Russula aff. rugulosa BPL654]